MQFDTSLHMKDVVIFHIIQNQIRPIAFSVNHPAPDLIEFLSTVSDMCYANKQTSFYAFF
jgi:hypothetical protein